MSSCWSLQDGQKILIRDADGMTGFHPGWNLLRTCLSTGWVVGRSSISTCSFTNENCTVISPQYVANQANELFINFTTETRLCTGLEGKACGNTFVLFVAYEFYSRRRIEVNIGNIPQFIPSHLNKKLVKRREIINFSKDQAYDYVMIGFNTSNYCGIVSSFSIYYYNCPESTNELVEFAQQAAPNIPSSPAEVLGKCTKNAVQRGFLPLVMKCFFNGSFEIRGSCECRPGFASINRKCKGWY